MYRDLEGVRKETAEKEFLRKPTRTPSTKGESATQSREGRTGPREGDGIVIKDASTDDYGK